MSDWQPHKDLCDELNKLRDENQRLRELLRAGACPNCDGSGSYHGNDGAQTQCQWCDERSAALGPAKDGS